MKKFEIKKDSIDIDYQHRSSIKPGVVISEWMEPELIASFDTLDDAREALKKYKSSVAKFFGHGGKSYFSVEEYFIEENVYDDDGDWVDGGDIWDFSELQIELVERCSWSDKPIAVFDNMKDAEAAMHNYNGDDEVCLRSCSSYF